VAVRPTILCGSCGSAITPADKYCAKCGTEVLWDAGVAATAIPSAPTTVICPSCGILNASSNDVCSGCGTTLAGAAASVRSRAPRKEEAAKTAPGGGRKRRLESWQTLSIAGIVIVAVLVAIGIFRNPPKEASPLDQTAESNSAPAVSASVLSDIDALQKRVDADPKDAESILHLANALHDAKFMPRAIAMYQKYLQLKPKDADARVDMGICYFESGDSETAIKEMKTALSYNPRHQMAMYNLGIVTLNQGNLTLSNEWFKKAADIDPGSQIGQHAQQILAQHSTIKQ